MEKGLLNIVLLGPPGSGKGAQAELLGKEYNLKKISVGDILRLEERKKTLLGKKIEKIIDKGDLIPSRLVVKIVKNHIGNKKNRLLFDGFPRDLYEAKSLNKLAEISYIFFISIPAKVTIKRLSNRYECYCGMTYNLLTKKPKHDLTCDICKRKLYRRADDNPAAIKERLRIYKKETLPVIRFYKSKIIKINGVRGINAVFSIIKRNINKDI